MGTHRLLEERRVFRAHCSLTESNRLPEVTSTNQMSLEEKTVFRGGSSVTGTCRLPWKMQVMGTTQTSLMEDTSLQSHNSDTSDEEDEEDFTTHNTLAVMEPNETLRNLRSEIDESMLQYLPGITALYFGKDDTHSEYLPLALRLGIFLDESEEHPGCSAWAYFKLQEAALELYVCHDPEGQYYIEGGAQTSLSRHYHDISFDDEFEGCNTAKDVVAPTKYFFLLAAETRNEKQYGLLSPDFHTTRLSARP
jgi:hypothetical protein